MNNRFFKTALLLALAALPTFAQAQEDPPARVGRISLTQGEVSISGEAGTPATAALVNWPVTSDNRITTGVGARAELRIGSTSVRLDGDSSLEVVELDDDDVRLRLDYGSASVRVVNTDMLTGFELVTPQARVRLRQPGRLRVDAERVRDTSTINVFDGEAVVEGGGASLPVRAGRSAELHEDDIRTAQATRDAFDEWALARDKSEQSSRSARYVTPEMTGYEELDRYGSWRTDSEYGALWIPSVAAGWVPYRDGRWTWISPWGWTWVDNAPWGYAPFHYGRWVHVNKRWAWAPGPRDRYPVWSPALVGWVGGAGWNLSFRARDNHRAPAQGWYPLSPRERFVPGYRLSDERLRRLNQHGPREERRDRDYRREGLTVVPHDHFGNRGPVVVPAVPQVTPASATLRDAPVAAPPPPLGWRGRDWRHEDGRDRDGRRHDGRDRFDRDRFDRDRRDRDQRQPLFVPAPATQPAPRPPVTILTAPPAMPGQAAPPQPAMPQMPEPRQPVTILTPPPNVPNQQAQPQQWPRPHHERRERFEDRPRYHQPASVAAPMQAPVQPAPSPTPPAPAAAPPAPSPLQPIAQPAPRMAPSPMPASAAPAAPARNPMTERRERRGVEHGPRQQEP